MSTDYTEIINVAKAVGAAKRDNQLLDEAIKNGKLEVLAFVIEFIKKPFKEEQCQ